MSGKSMRLRFKGDKVEKKKKRKSSESGEKRTRSKDENAESDVEAYDGNEKAWVPVERLTDLAGPSLFYQRTDNEQRPFVCVAWEPLRHRVEAYAIASSSAVGVDEAALLDLDGAQVVVDSAAAASSTPSPTDVNQVWVATRVLDTPSDAPRYTLRSAEARFLTAERKSGAVSADAEARGPLEEWTLMQTTRGSAFALRGAHGTFLGTDEVAGGKKAVRSDFEGATTTTSATDKAAAPYADVEAEAQWHIVVQWKFRHEARKRERGVAPLRDRDPTFKRIKT